MPRRIADSLCRIATGAAIRVETAAPDEPVYAAVDRPVILALSHDAELTHIAPADLVDRCLLVDLPGIAPRQRCRNAVLAAAYRDLRPEILGALCSAGGYQRLRIDGEGGSGRGYPCDGVGETVRFGDLALSQPASAALAAEHVRSAKVHCDAAAGNPRPAAPLTVRATHLLDETGCRKRLPSPSFCGTRRRSKAANDSI